MKFGILGFFKFCHEKSSLVIILKEQPGTLREDIHIFIISRAFLLRMRNVSDKSCRENQSTHFVCNDFSSKN
jgi:hypothetical protein